MTVILNPAPDAVCDSIGQPQCGKYMGALASIDWSDLSLPYRHSAWWRYFHHKRWQYVALATDQLFCGIAIIDVGWTNTAFAYVFDRVQKKIIASFSQDGLPRFSAQIGNLPLAGAESHFHCCGHHIDWTYDGTNHRQELQLSSKEFSIHAELSLSLSAPGLSAIGLVQGGSVHSTYKSAGTPMTGEVLVGGERFSLDSGIASCDYSNGFLARETAWRWASAHGLRVGFNLQQGYFDQYEKALWLDGQLISLGAAHFDYDPQQALLPWHIYTDDGLLDLHFTPEGCRSENKNLLVAASRYIQPIGRFNGWVKANKNAAPERINELAGVTEDHASRW